MMRADDWRGVFPAITTPFTEDNAVDHAFLAHHTKVMIDAGCRGIVPLGSLGEGATLTHTEKLDILRTVRKTTDLPIVATISALSTDEAVGLAKEAEQIGCDGLMILPPYVYRGTEDEMLAHMSAVMAATGLSCMLYNNPIAYGTDFTPDQVQALADKHSNLHSIKESSADIRRLAEIQRLIGSRLALFMGVDDIIVEGVAAGAVGWIAGQVNAFPKESVDLFEAALEGRRDSAAKLYNWFLPLLRLDTVPKFVQLIKLTQQEVDLGSERVRMPRMVLKGSERDVALRTIREGIVSRP
jgi:4-hydroxy-tetrahydrodipicolinate synthase